VKQPGVLLEHGGDTYLCVEGGYNAETRAITLLAGPSNSHFSHDEGTTPITWRDQGEWFPIARFRDHELILQNQDHAELADYAGEIVSRYISESPADPEVAWALSSEHGFSGSLEDVLPQGVAVTVYDNLEQADEAIGEDTLVPIQNVAQFLTHMAREGYAGAMWNHSLPVFFCIDANSDLQFLRIAKGSTETIDMQILDPVVGWDPYDGAEDISFLDNSDACDKRLADVLGDEPLLGWPEDGQLWSLGPVAGEPALVSVAEDGLTYALLFTAEDAAEAWLEDVEDPWMRWPVTDLAALLGSHSVDGCAGLLNPGAHRARRGVFWKDSERIILDSFSGFWLLQKNNFTALKH
jgi:hypothetical protein